MYDYSTMSAPTLAERCLHRPGQVEEDAMVVETEIGQVIREVGEVVADADFQVVSEIA